MSQRWFTFFNRKIPNIILRLFTMALGFTCVAFAVALSRATGLGTSAISCIPCVLSFIFPITIGTFTFVMNVLFVVFQKLLLGKDFKPIQILQIPFVFVFSAIIDFWVPICEMIPMDSYLASLFFVFVSVPIMAFGVWIQVQTKLIMLPGDSIVLALSKTFNQEYGKIKVAFDSSNVVIGAICSLIALGGLFGVREGTIIAALTVGFVMRFYTKMFPHINRIIPTEGHLTLSPQSQAEKESIQNTTPPLVITISREFGSGGREIGKIIARELNIPIYDKSLIDMTAKQAGLTHEFVARNEEDVRHGILYNLYAQNYEYIGASPSEVDSIFLAQAKIITQLADSESCVLVGRCSNYILANRKNCFNVFVKAPLGAKVKRVMQRDKVTDKKAISLIKAIDSERANHAKLYTGQTWGDINNYHLCIDSSLSTPERIAALVIQTIKDSPDFTITDK